MTFQDCDTLLLGHYNMVGGALVRHIYSRHGGNIACLYPT
jgi:hypothetical protein